MRAVIVLTVLGAAFAQNGPRDVLWGAFKRDFGKEYDVEEELMRFEIFKSNMDFIDAHNAEGHSYTLGVGPFADLTNSEFKASLPDPKRARAALSNTANPIDWSKLGVTDIPRSVDWKKKGAVTEVKNQGLCGDCWAFSATGALEGLEFLTTQQKPTPLSEQQLVDCTRSAGEAGCGGGTMSGAFDYAKSNGLCSESDYPYISGKNPKANQTCAASKCAPVLRPATFQSVINIPPTEAAVAAALVDQPISIGIEADKPEFQHYKAGVFDNMECGTNLDHGVLLVGFGEVGNQSCDTASSRVCTTQQTCCPLVPGNPSGKKWGCCPLENAKCCPASHPGDQQNCCPDSMVCYQCPGPKCGCVTSEENEFLNAMHTVEEAPDFNVHHFPILAKHTDEEAQVPAASNCTAAASVHTRTCFVQDQGDKATVTITHQKDTTLTPEMCAQYCEANSTCLAWNVIPSTVPVPLKQYQGCFLVSGEWDGYRSACPYQGDSSGCSTRGVQKHPEACCPTKPLDTKKFWTVKNSWGSQWGENGYIKIMKDTGGPGLCGLAMTASYPSAKAPASDYVV